MITRLICAECPNGCNLSLEWKDAVSVVVSDNQCSRGIGYAARMLCREKDVHIEAKEKTAHFSQEAITEILKSWNIPLSRLRYDIPIQGSPERSLFRVVIENADKELFVLEQIAIKNLDARRRIAKTLDLLSQKKTSQLNPYLKNISQEHLTQHKATFWQVAPFVQGVALEREKYMLDSWRGKALAEFLIDLRQAGETPFFNTKKVFSLKSYIHKLVRNIATYKGDVLSDIKDIVDLLEKDFLTQDERLPSVFCHGDYHPMNMIWGNDRIACVIDWEFSGYKNEIYDMANLIGCVGVENPQGLSAGLVMSFVRRMQEARIISAAGWHYLVDCVLALRFAWLSEWLRRSDKEMTDLELDYMHLLIENREDLKKYWGVKGA